MEIINEKTRDYNLELFLMFVDKGKTPPPELMGFIADGVREFLDSGKPWQISRTGRKKRASTTQGMKLAATCYILQKAGLTYNRLAAVVGKTSTDGKDTERTLRDYIKEAKKLGNDETTFFLFDYVIEKLLNENKELTIEERKKIKSLNFRSSIDEREPC